MLLGCKIIRLAIIWSFISGDLVLSTTVSQEQLPLASEGLEMPEKWQSFCNVTYQRVSGSNFSAQWAFLVSCDLNDGDVWSLSDYRQWISANEKKSDIVQFSEETRFAIHLMCNDKTAKLSLPWPFRAKYLWHISVQNCTVEDYLQEYNSSLDANDTLKVIELIDVTLVIETLDFFHILNNYNEVSDQYRCGGEQLEKFVKRNLRQVFSEPNIEQTAFNNTGAHLENPTSTEGILSVSERPDLGPTITPGPAISQEEQDMLDAIAKFGQDHQKTQKQCSFANLQYIDESYSTSVAKEHNHFMTEGSQYPALRYYNMSHSRLIQLSPMLLAWRRYFPKMLYMDLSHNNIKYFTSFSDYGLFADGIGVFDLRYNNITSLTSDDLDTLRLHSNTVFIDIRDNPFSCDCKLSKVLDGMKDDSSYLITRYPYLNDLECVTPEIQRGRTFRNLDKHICENVQRVFLVEPIIVVCCFTLFAFIVLTVVIKYRKEILILAFTRLHISLPCRKVIKESNKTYDAFIAYAEQDGTWVFSTLLPRLEEPIRNGGPGFKLCIHHRDFPVGVYIADNIIDKVKDSNHTILILSNNFLRSQWCKYEFKTAFTQSLSEKKQHLLMIIVEELDTKLIDRDLKRCLQTFTYVKLEDRFLWDKLVYALSDRPSRNRSLNKETEIQGRQQKETSDLKLQGISTVKETFDGMYVNIGQHVLDKTKKKDDIDAIQDGIWNV